MGVNANPHRALQSKCCAFFCLQIIILEDCIFAYCTISLFCKPFVYFDIFCSHFVCPDHFVFIIFLKSQISLQIVILYHFFANCCSRSNYSANCRSRSLFANCFSGSNCFASFRFSSLLANCSTECKEDQSETVPRFPIKLLEICVVYCSLLHILISDDASAFALLSPPLFRAPPGLSLSRSLSLS